MIYNMLLCPIAFLTTIHIVVKDLALSSPLNDPPRRKNGIHEGVDNENHWILEGQVKEKDYNTDIIEVTSLHTQYESQHGKNKQETKSEHIHHWTSHAKRCSNEIGRKVQLKQYLNQL